MMKRAVQLDPRNVLRLETLAENLTWTFLPADVRVVGPDGSRKVLSEALTGTVRWLEDFEGEAGL